MVSLLRDWLCRPGERLLDLKGIRAGSWFDRSPAWPRSPPAHGRGPLHTAAQQAGGVPGHPALAVPQEPSHLRKALAAEGVTHQAIRGPAVLHSLDALRELHQAQWGSRCGVLPVFDRFAVGFAGGCAADEVVVHELGRDNLVVATVTALRPGLGKPRLGPCDGVNCHEMMSMKLPHGRRVHVGARPARRPRPAWPWMLVFRRQYHREIAKVLSDLDAAERRRVAGAARRRRQPSRRARWCRSRCAGGRTARPATRAPHRQTVVDVICAYLRMPFSATAPADKREPRATEDPGGPDTETETGADGIGGAWWQERQVRLTAQRILAEHLRDDRAKQLQPIDPSSARFWSDMRPDLAGATLIDFFLVNGVMADANFGGATFTGDA